MDILQLQTIFLVIHLLGVALGAGGAFASDGAFFSSIKDKKVSNDELGILKILSSMTWFGLLLLIISGVGMFSLNPVELSASAKFLAKMTIVAVILMNGIVFHLIHLPFIGKHLNKALVKKESLNKMKDTPWMIVSGVVSLVSWFVAIILGALRNVQLSYIDITGIYLGLVALGIFFSYLLFKKFLVMENNRKLLLASIVLLLVAGGLIVLGVFRGAEYINNQKNIEASQEEVVSFTFDDVALHNNPEDCWLVIDDLVFDATEASRLHPAMFNCGTDASVNYHKNHGVGISDKMMVYHIGSLGSGTGITRTDSPFEKKLALDPYAELYVEVGSWNVDELMVIVEKDAEKLLFIDGVSHTEIGRIHDIGFQPHTSVYSPDGAYMFIISRDGWLTKIDLKTLDPITSLSVGDNSRGTALTDDGKYIAIGNYEPGSIVIVDPSTMKILKIIDTVGEINGAQVESRVGALIEDGDHIIAALKDLNSVWVVDTSTKDFVVKNKYNNIGDNNAPLHDAFLTPDGKYFIVASMGSNTVWVLDTDTWKVVKEVPTGITPHTGPGATWGNTIYIPAMGEGLITAINTISWEPIASIPTGGPGLFVRSYSKNPDYPYVWADTAFGDHHDEIYVIDARINKIIKTIIPVKGESSWHPEFTYNGDYVYVVSQTADEIEIYDAHTFEIVKRITADTPSAVSNIGIRIEELGL
jgi:YVTN family beta-propeller protein